MDTDIYMCNCSGCVEYRRGRNEAEQTAFIRLENYKEANKELAGICETQLNRMVGMEKQIEALQNNVAQLIDDTNKMEGLLNLKERQIETLLAVIDRMMEG